MKWLFEMLNSANKIPPDGAMCLFDHNTPAIGLFEFSDGCVCFKDKLQYLCVDHAYKTTPIKTFNIIHVYK